MPVAVILEIIPAAIISGVVLLLSWKWREQAWPFALAIGAGFAATHAYARGFHGLLPPDSTMLLFHFALAATVLGLVDARLPRALAWGLRLAMSLAVAWLLLRGLPDRTWAWMGGAGLALFVVWMALDWRARAVDGWAQPLAVAIAAAGGGAALERAKSGVLGQMAGALAAAVGPLVLFGLLNGKQSLRNGGAGVVAVIAAALWMCGYFFTESFPLLTAVLLAAAPLAATRKRWWAGALIAIALVAVAVYLAHQANLPDPDDPYADYYK